MNKYLNLAITAGAIACVVSMASNSFAQEETTPKVPAAMTEILPQETITGYTSTELPPPPPVQPIYFTLPIDLMVVKDANITTDTPISDKYTAPETWDVKAWGAAVSSCLQQSPKLVRVVKMKSVPAPEGEETTVPSPMMEVPFMLGGKEGTIMLNANDKSVCPM
jgi:hypothetical protein